MEKSKMLLKIEAREASILSEINATDPELIECLPVLPSDILEVLGSLDEEAIVNQLTEELQEAMDSLNKEDLKFEGIDYEWRYNSYDPEFKAIGNAYEKCKYKFLSNADTGPDNNWVSMNNDKPELSGKRFNVRGLSVHLAMVPWYEKLFSKIEETGNNDVENWEITLYDELFKLNAFKMLDVAYSRVTGVKPSYFCVGLYGFWHSMVSEYKIEA